MSSADSERMEFRRRLRRAQTEAERKLWYRLRDRRLAGFKFVRQDSIGRYVADFCCREAKLIIEVDGSQQADNPYDRARDAWLADLGYRVLRFWNAEIMSSPSVVLDTIFNALPPSPRTRGEGCGDLVVGAASPKGGGEGSAPNAPVLLPSPHPRLPPRFVNDEVDEAISPRAGRWGANL